MKRARRAALVLAALLGASATAAPTAIPLAPAPQPSPSPGTRTTRALLIGIDRYVSDQLKTLHGCVNDVERMREVLVGRFRVPPDNIKVLKNDEATRDAILDAIRTHLLAPANDGDVLILHFSGHGAQAVDDSGDEPDGLDETIVPHDSRVGTVFDITDDEINERLAELTARTPNVIFILDSCHSGAASKAADLGTSVRQAPTDMRHRPRTAPPARGLMEGPNEVRPLGARYVMISGSLPNELSNEGVFPDGFDGALTHALTEALKTAPERTTYRDVMDAVKTKVTARFPSQHPQLEGAGLDTVVFGTEQLTARPFVLVEPTPDGKLQIAAGEIHGLTPGTVLRVYAPGTKDFAGATVVARARITSVQPFSAVAEVQGAGTVEEHSRAVLDAVRSPGFRAGVFLEGVDASTLLQAVRRGLSEYDLVREVNAPAEAQLRLRVADGQARLSNAEGEALGSVPDVAASADDLVGRVLHWAQWYALLSLEGQSPGLDVDLRIEREGPGGTWEAVGEEVSEGTKLQITATNKSSTPLFLVLLDLTSDGAVQPLRPSPGQPPEAVSPGKSITLHPIAGLKQGAVRVTDVLKVIATTAQVPADTFALGVAKRGAPLGGDAENPMARYLRLAVEGRARDLLEPVQVDEWMTRQRTLRVSRPSARARSFAAHYAAGTAPRAVEDALRAGARTVCTGADRARCYEAVPSGIDDSIVEVLAPTQRDPAAPPPSVGRAFEEAYALRAETRALRVEPLFEVDLPAAARPPEARDSLMRSAAHDPRAQADPRWSLKHVRAPEAWAALQALGRPAGAEAKGIAIAHPDTGYRPHPEIWDAVPDRRPVWAEKGHDYVDDDADATDPLVKDGLLDNPGHGTGSGSAIVSPADCQLAGAAQCPTGVAPGARLVPLRVHKSVVHFDTKQMSQAIADASGGDRTRVGVATNVMSVSMGGVPSWTLWRAVTNAEKRGYLIVAAAGNYVHTVVWPARFDSTIAVAATNVGCRPWAHTSAGAAVDISAPGESVWRGAVERDGTFTTGMGSGTTFATATVAGVAALWMARYAATPEFQALRNEGRVTETFRRLLQETAWKPGAVPSQAPAGVVCDDAGPWNTGLMGAGIADAAALLAKPLPAGGPRTAAVARSLEDLPLFATLYPVGTARETVWVDYRRLFTAGPDDSALGEYESEVMFHYAQSRDVAIALDRVVEAGDRSDGAFTQASEALRGLDLSLQLRGALRR